MKDIIEYILESNNLQELKDKIINSLDSLSEEQLHNILDIINPIDEKELNERLLELGFDGAQNGLLKVISKFTKKEREFIYNNIILNKDDENNPYKFSPKEFIENKNHNIYDLINSKCIDNDNNLIFSNDNLKLLADYNSKSGKQVGKFEFLTQLFIKDLVKNNEGKNDINTKDYQFEFKGFRGAIKGQETTGQPSLVYKKFNELLNKYFEDKKITDKEEYEDLVKNMKQYNFLQTKDMFTSYFSKLIKIIPDVKDINKILGESLLKQINGIQDIKQYIDKIVNFLNEDDNNPFKNNEVDVNIFWYDLLVIHLFFYYLHHKWSYFVIFGVIDSKGDSDGKYLVIEGKIFEELNKIRDTFKKYRINNVKGMTNDDRGKSPAILLYSKDIK